MARGRSRRSERDLSNPTLRSLDRSLLGAPVSPSRVTDFFDPPPSLIIAEDRRRFWPGRAFLEPARTIQGVPSRVIATPARKARTARPGSPVTLYSPRAAVAFEAPREVAVCVRRQRRREVLFAFRKGGRGGPQRKRRRSSHSDVSCR